LKNYFALTNKSAIVSLGQYKNFSEAFDHNEDTPGNNLVWIFSENNLKQIQEQIQNVLGMSND